MTKLRFVLLVGVGLWLSTPAGAQSLGPTQQITVQDSGNVCSVAGTCAIFNVGSSVSLTFNVIGTYSGTLTFQGNSNGNWQAIQVAKLSTGSVSTTTTSTGDFAFTNTGFSQVRVVGTTINSGGASVTASRGYGSGGAGGGGGGGGAVTIADGADANAGSTTDTAVAGDANGTISGKLRQLDKLFTTSGAHVICDSGCSGGTAVTDNGTIATGQSASLSAAILQAYDGANWKRVTFGQQLAAASLPVVLPASQLSTLVTEAGTITANQSSSLLSAAVLFGYDGSTDSRVGAKTSIPASNSVGLFTRPLMQTDGTNSLIIDPCSSSGATISSVPISQTTNTMIKAGTSAKKTYVCGIFVQASDAENISLVEGTTGGTCGSGTAALIGATTAAAGMNGAANGGWVLPVSGTSWVGTATNQNDICLFQSGSGRVAGVMKVAVQ